jgi:hypothetical protein
MILKIQLLSEMAERNMILPDLSSGQEQYPIGVYNDFTGQKVDINFKYIMKNRIPRELESTLHVTLFYGSI